ncbi:DUF748 repeat protein [Geotalea daltonii FRC-32]|uniref:DUF748 repeat protein n=1 Tax=Geotalea daltonii (strain DSM 22248 / JCM 15807 / FRC-32) TaxID=316067 RepID=B9M3X2_GEODF|nr:DUF748 domain-containing protein [Geotalea daltonii]ACM19615.1 DUF748 repeat protein [Geotalea daltonii FRC-32]
MPLWKKLAIAAAAFFTLLVLFVAFVLPGIVRSQAEKKVGALTGRTLAIRHISINPLTMRVKVDGLQMQEPGGKITFVSFSSASARLSPASIWRRAPIVTGIHVISPYVRIVRTGANRYNFSDIPERMPKSEKKSSSPTLFSLNNITVTGGSINFDDRAARTPKLHTVRRMHIAVPFISNIPYLVDQYIQPRFAAEVNGASLDLTGRLKPFQKGMETLLDVNLTDLDIPYYAAYLPVRLPMAIKSGKFSSKIAISYRVTPDKKPVIAITGDAAVVRLAMAEKSEGELLSFDRFAIKINQADLMGGSYDIASVNLDAPVVTLLRTADGRWPNQRMMPPAALAGEEKAEKPAEKKPAPLVRIAEIRLNGGKVRLDDRLPAGGFRSEIHELTALVTGLATRGEDAADYEISFSTTRGEHLELAGDLALEPMEGSAMLNVSGVPLEAYHPYVADRLTSPVSGRAELNAEASWTKEDGIVIDDLGLKLLDVAVRLGKGDGARIGEAVLAGGKLDLKKRTAAVGSISFRKAKVAVTRDAAGKLSLLSLLRENKPSASVNPAKTVAKQAAPFHYTVSSVVGKGIDVSFRDEARSSAPRFDLKSIDVSATGITDILRIPIPVRFNASYGGGAKLSAKGNITREPLRYNGAVQVKNLPIPDFSPYFPDDLNIYLADGNLDLAATLDVTKGEQLTGSFSGNMGLRNLYALDTVDTDDLLKWESLQVEEVRGTLKPLVVNVGGISLNRFLARLVVDREGIINLKKIRSGPVAQAAVANVQPAPAAVRVAPDLPSPAAAQQKPEAARPEIRIDTVTLQEGTVSFLDQHTPQQFGTTMYNLGGRISGLSSEDFRYADVDLRGDLDKHSPLQITGKINPLSRELFADLKVRFTDIELSPVTPYAGTYLGYEIDKGKLFLDLTYKIEKKTLNAQNKVFIDQFTFGKGVDSGKATKLPVRLAVALLKDRHGEIHLDLPVTGRTDDPEFSIFGVVLTVLKNLLVKAATAPFALLQSAFSGGEDLSNVNFAYGSSQLSAEERTKVAKLAGALEQRPGVKLEMTAYVDREKDAEGYRNELLARKMKGEKFAALVKERKNAPGETPEKMEILPAEHDLYLKAVYVKEKFPKPRNALGFVKDIPAPEMKKLILANTLIGDPQLQALSRERVAAVRTLLISEGNLPPERIFEKGGDMLHPPEKKGQPLSRVEFGVNVQ